MPHAPRQPGPPDVEEVAGAVLETVPRTMRAIRERMRAGRPSGMSVAQFRVLLFIRRHPATSLSAVAEHLGVSLPGTSQLVERLVRAGYVDRRPSEVERRRVELRLTDAGGTVLGEHDERTREWLRRRLGSLDPERLGRLAGALEDLRAIASDEPEGGPER